MGTAPSCLQHYRTSLEAGSDRPASARHSECSASITELLASLDPLFLDYLTAACLTASHMGLRTMRALTTAGLLHFRLRYSLSHMAFSEAGSSSSMAASVSSVFAAQQHLCAELVQVQERHTLETGVLLHMLVDSQCTAWVLRDENALLRDQLQELEG
ncbi:hypothetical protein OBBRIDRAFT_831042 [Obba rivulosa]|uniref:Uncharacterized protein n=1 Tax=Obba rivulosa TaxID=1052685 RepID=A0A8E2DSW0_9APHY|nr:hypothetical protein OBBRIDRAFT_831042 [Obba rivulosa]